MQLQIVVQTPLYKLSWQVTLGPVQPIPSCHVSGQLNLCKSVYTTACGGIIIVFDQILKFTSYAILREELVKSQH